MKTSVRALAFFAAALLCACYYAPPGTEAAFARDLPHFYAPTPRLVAAPERKVDIDWDPAVELLPGDFFNITVSGFSDYKLVMVFLYLEGDFSARVKYDLSGRLGFMQVEAPGFPPGSRVAVRAVAIPSWDEPTRFYGSQQIEGPHVYRFGGEIAEAHLVVTRRSAYGLSKFRRSVSSVYVDGNPTIIRLNQLITIVWNGFPVEAKLIIRLVCPDSEQSLANWPASQNYVTFPISIKHNYPQSGCYVTVSRCNLDLLSGECVIDSATTVVENSVHVLLNSLG